MKINSCICPGCSIGCSLYLVESEVGEGAKEKIKVLHRKTGAVNEGKLCKFGTGLHAYYEREALNNSVDGKEVKQEEAIKEAKERLKGMKPEELAFITLPSTITNEEIVSFVSLASGCENISVGFERFFKEIPEEASYIIEKGLPFSEVEKASKIILFFIDPFVHYPLLARRILKAKKNGAKVIEVSFAKNERGIADETVLVNPMAGMGKIKEEKEIFEDSLIIGELTPYTNLQFLLLMLWLDASTSSRLFLLKPFLNSTGAFLLDGNGKEARKRKDLFEILDEIERGEIKALYLLETDLVGAMFESEEVAKTISKLDLLIEQNAFKTALSDTTNITLRSDPFFMKKGTVVNIEGGVLGIGGESEKGLQIMESIGKGRSYEAVHEEAKKRLGLSEINEFEIAVKREERNFEVAEPKIEKEEERTGEAGYLLWYKTNPFFWNGIRDKNFVEISPAAMRKLGLFRGDEIEIVQGEWEERMGFEISELPDYLILSEAKLAIKPLQGLHGKEMLTGVEMRRAE